MRLRPISVRIMTAASAVALAVLSFAAVPALAGIPSNDNWADARLVGSLPAIVTGNSNSATTEDPNEPISACNNNHTTVWFKLKVVRDTYLLVDMRGTSFEAGVTIWKGNSLATLHEVACSYDNTKGDTAAAARVTFLAGAGVRYYLQVSSGYDFQHDSYPGGAIRMRIKQVTPPANDAFSRATSVSLPYHATISNIQSTTESGEPKVGPCSNMRATRWYKVRLANTTTVRAETIGSLPDTVIAVFSGGPSIGALNYIGCDDDTSLSGANAIQSRVTWVAKAHRTYWIQVGGYDNETGDLDLAIKKVTRPANDDRSAAKVIPNVTTTPYINNLNTRNATWQKGETVDDACTQYPGHGDNLYLQSTWYRYTAPNTDMLHVAVTADQGVDPVVVIYTGGSFGTQAQVTCTITTVDFTPANGTTYYFQVVGEDGRTGPIQFTLERAT
jgi:hypothetical protein